MQTATPPLLRRLNAGAVMEALRTAGVVTGTELMEATGLSRPTVHAACDQLIALGWVTERESRRSADGSRAGRPARQYELNARAGYAMGIDMGAGTVRAVVSDLRGDPIGDARRTYRHWHVSAPERLSIVRTAINAALTAARVPASAVLAVGLGVPGPVGNDGHIVAVEEYLPGLAEVDLRAAIGRRRGWPVLVENDANLAVLGERWRGAAVGLDNVVLILAGERLGAGIYLGGRLIRGGAGGAGELALLRLVEGVGSTDGIGNLARSLGLEAVRRHRGGQHGKSPLSRAAASRGALKAEAVLDAARSGDPLAVQVLDEVTDRIARVVAVVATLLDPELVVIGGAVADAGELLLKPLEAKVPAYTTWRPRLATASFGDHSVVVGAVRLALDHIESQVFESLTTRESTA